MAKLADFSNTASVAPCKRCGELLGAAVRHCPECGKDQTIADEPGDPSVAPDSVRAALADPPRVAPFNTVLPYDEVQRAMAQEIVPPLPYEAADAASAAGSAIGFLRPGLYWEQDAQPAGNDRRFGWADRGVSPSRLVIGVLAALVLALGAALSYDMYADRQREQGREAAYRANMARMQDALQRGDSAAAHRALGALMLVHPDDPAIAGLRTALERQATDGLSADAAPKAERPLTATALVALPSAATQAAVSGAKASGRLAPAKPSRETREGRETANADTPADAIAEVRPETRTASVSGPLTPAPIDTPAAALALATPAPSTTPPPAKACSDALAAMSLCGKD